MPLRAETGGDIDVSQVLGLPLKAPPAPTAVPTQQSGSPLVSTTPQPGAGIALDLNGRIPQSVQQVTAGYELAYVTISSPATINATSFATANTIITSPALDFDGKTTVMIYAKIPRLATSTVATFLTLWEDSNDLGIVGQWKPDTAASMDVLAEVSHRRTPLAGSHIFTLKGAVNSGTATADCGAGGAGVLANAYLRIVRV